MEGEISKEIVYHREIKGRGYYKRSIAEHPVVGTYKLDQEKLIMNTQDNAGVARWFGKINSNSLSMNINIESTFD